MNELLTTSAAADYLGVCQRTLIRWRNARTGPAWTKVGHQVRYQAKDLQAWLDAQRVQPVREVAA